jgi:hypothetical protein
MRISDFNEKRNDRICGCVDQHRNPTQSNTPEGGESLLIDIAILRHFAAACVETSQNISRVLPSELSRKNLG